MKSFLYTLISKDLTVGCKTCEYSFHFGGSGYMCTNTLSKHYNPGYETPYMCAEITNCIQWLPKTKIVMEILQKLIKKTKEDEYMAYLKDLEPNLRDEVKHREFPEGMGIVIAKYPSQRAEDNGKILLDVKVDDNFIYYGTPAANWEVTKLNDEAD